MASDFSFLRHSPTLIACTFRAGDSGDRKMILLNIGPKSKSIVYENNLVFGRKRSLVSSSYRRAQPPSTLPISPDDIG